MQTGLGCGDSPKAGSSKVPETSHLSTYRGVRARDEQEERPGAAAQQGGGCAGASKGPAC